MSLEVSSAYLLKQSEFPINLTFSVKSIWVDILGELSEKFTILATEEKEDILNKFEIQSLHNNFYTCDSLKQILNNFQSEITKSFPTKTYVRYMQNILLIHHLLVLFFFWFSS